MSGFLSGEAFAVDTKNSGTLTGLRWGSASELPVLPCTGGSTTLQVLHLSPHIFQGFSFSPWIFPATAFPASTTRDALSPAGLRAGRAGGRTKSRMGVGFDHGPLSWRSDCRPRSHCGTRASQGHNLDRGAWSAFRARNQAARQAAQFGRGIRPSAKPDHHRFTQISSH